MQTPNSLFNVKAPPPPPLRCPRPPSSQQRQCKKQKREEDHALIRISPDVLQNLINYLKVKEVACIMVSNRQFRQHFLPIFNNLGNGNGLWQRFFHKRMAKEAPWTEMCLLGAELPMHFLQNYALAFNSIISQSRHFLNKNQHESLFTLLNTCKSSHDLNNIEASFRILANRHSQSLTDPKLRPDNKFKEYYTLTKSLSFVNAEEFSRSVQDLDNLYVYRALIKRHISKDRIQQQINFTPSREFVKLVRKTNSKKWRSLLELRAGISKTTSREAQAYPNWLNAETLVAARAEQGLPVTIEWIEEIHGVLSKGLANNGHPAGCCRSPVTQVWASETKRFYVDGKYVRREMEDFIEWLDGRLALHNREEHHAGHTPYIILTAAQASQWLVSIHPFADGNGRTSRLVMDYILQRYGILPPNLSQWIAPVYGDKGISVDENHAFDLVWKGIEETYRMKLSASKPPQTPH